MSKLNELVEWLDEESRKYKVQNAGILNGIVRGKEITRQFILDKARSLLAEEAAQKPTAPPSVIEYPCPTCGEARFETERRIDGDSWCRNGHKHPTKDFICHAPTESIVEEPLAVLAKRKGFWKTITLNGVDSMANGFVSVEIEREVFDIRKEPKRSDMFVARTHAAAEAKARQYLNGIPDREAK